MLFTSYPAGHVFIHDFLSKMANKGLNLRRVQHIYVLLYLGSLTITCLLYRKAGGIPNYALLLLPLSKRLHSIFMLRLFNDCWALIMMQTSALAFIYDFNSVGAVLFRCVLVQSMSLVIGVKQFIQRRLVYQNVDITLSSRSYGFMLQKNGSFAHLPHSDNYLECSAYSWIPFSRHTSLLIYFICIRNLTCFPLQVDSQLAIHPRKHLPEHKVCSSSSSSSSNRFSVICRFKMVHQGRWGYQCSTEWSPTTI